MELCTATLRLGGSVGHTVEKPGRGPGITPAEIAVLRDIHGADAVLNLKVIRNDKRSPGVERQRLEKLYGPDAVNKLFPGALAVLPQTIKEIGLSESETPMIPPGGVTDLEEPSADDLIAMGLDGGDGMSDDELEAATAPRAAA